MGARRGAPEFPPLSSPRWFAALGGRRLKPRLSAWTYPGQIGLQPKMVRPEPNAVATVFRNIAKERRHRAETTRKARRHRSRTRWNANQREKPTSPVPAQ